LVKSESSTIIYLTGLMVPIFSSGVCIILPSQRLGRIEDMFSNWENFYVITGSSAGALTGLQFVVITLIAQARTAGGMQDIRAFGTPTVVHFCTALLISALMTVPWRTLTEFDVCLALCGIAGIAYSLSIFVHARRAAYTPDLEDWIWYTVLPFIAHIALAAAALVLLWNTGYALDIVAADTLLFLLLGIHNAWDTVTYIAVQHMKKSNEAADGSSPKAST